MLPDSWETWAPGIRAEYQHCHESILKQHPNLDLVYPTGSSTKPPFASLTANLGPQTVCESHTDIKNLAWGICACKPLGPYNFRLGGHIILHDLQVVVEMRPGDVIFFPSAVVTHETVPISEAEKRYSLVWYSAGGLFRWVDAGGRGLKEYAQLAPNEHHEHQNNGFKRWTEGWLNFSTLPQLVKRVAPSVQLKVTSSHT